MPMRDIAGDGVWNITATLDHLSRESENRCDALTVALLAALAAAVATTIEQARRARAARADRAEQDIYFLAGARLGARHSAASGGGVA